MKICFFTTDFPPTLGGIAEFSRSLVYHTSESPEVENVYVVALKNKESGIEKPNKKLTILRDDKKSLIWMCINVFRFILRFRSCDVFHSISVFPVGFFTVIIGKYIFRKKVFVTFHGSDMLATEGKRITKLAKVWTLRNATKAITVSHSTKREVAKRYMIPEEYFTVIYYPLGDEPSNVSSQETKKLKEKYSITKDDFIVLFIGNLIRRKGPQDLIDAISQIFDQNVKLLLVGNGPLEEELKKKVKDYNLEHRVIFTGKVPDVSPFYSLAHMFSMPSFFDREYGDIEGLGIVYLEAQQHGLPVLGTKSGGIPEAIEDGKSGFLVPERSIDGLVQKIEFLAHNKEVAKKMGERGKEFVRERFNWRKSIREHIDCYRSSF